MNFKELPFVSIIVPCRNEEKFIGKCLDSIVNNDYPKDRLEVLIGEGMGEDKTREIIEGYIREHSFIQLFDNPKKIAPIAQNIGLKKAKGKIIIIMDAHSTYARDYISKCLEYLNKYNADNVGGVIITVPRENTLVAKAIAFSLSHPFGAGNSYFRIGSKKPRWVDTVPFGCYKREIFEKIGFYNEKLASSYDMDFNLRLGKAGGKILLVPDIVSYYYARSTLKAFWGHNFYDGIWVIYPLRFGIKIFSWRHLTPLVFVTGLIGSGILSIFFWPFFFIFLFIIGLYLFTNIYFSIEIGVKEKDIRFLFLMPIAFATRHIGYGLGSICGLIKILI